MDSKRETAVHTSSEHLTEPVSKRSKSVRFFSALKSGTADADETTFARPQNTYADTSEEEIIGKNIDSDDGTNLEKFYVPIETYEGKHRYDPKATWSREEERSLIRKLDVRVCAWCCLMFFALQLDRGNIQQALSDNLLNDLHMNTNDYNTGRKLSLFQPGY